MSWILNNTQLDQLKCTTCKNYISYGPITQICDDDGYNCGRCCGNGIKINTFFEKFAKNCLFPCIYDVNGCGAKIVYGADAFNHEKLCKFRPSSCPVGDCVWNGTAIKSLDHCLNEHDTHFVEDNQIKFNINLMESLNTKRMMKIKTGEVLLMHLLYSEETGFSVNIKSFLLKTSKTVLNYTLVLQSINAGCKMEFGKKGITSSFEPDFKWIPFTTLLCIDETALTVTVRVKRDESTIVIDACDCCDEPLPLMYTLRCPKKHQFCYNCRNIQQPCIICSDCLRLGKGDLFACSNALVYGCTFISSSLLEIQEHERKCVLIKCMVKTCQWSNIEDKLFEHLMTHPITVSNKINIKSDKFGDDTYFISLYASCNCYQNHIHNRGLFIVQISLDDASNTIKIIANYVTSSIGTRFIKGNIEVKLGKATYRGCIGRMNGCAIDESSEIRLYRPLIKGNEVVTIELTSYKLFCT